MSDRTSNKDTRYVYGAGCLWHDEITKASITGPHKILISGRTVLSSGLPCCPFCGSMLFEMPNKEEFFKGAKDFDKIHPGYLEALIWSQGKCFSSLALLIEAYNKDQGKNLNYNSMFKK